MARSRCCSKRSVRLARVNKVKATKKANAQTKKGHPKKKAAKKTTAKKAKKPCRACQHKRKAA